MRFFRVVAMIFAWAQAASAQDDFGPAVLAEFVAYWPGDYSNQARIAEQAARGVPPQDRNRPLNLYIRPMNPGSFGAHAVYAEWRNAVTGALERQRIYAFGWDHERGAIRLALHIWPQRRDFIARTAGAYLDPSKLDAVFPEDMEGTLGCDVYFRPGEPNEYAGAMDKGACAFDAPDGTPIYSWSQMKIGPSRFSYLDGWFRRDGAPFQTFGSEWYSFAKTQRWLGTDMGLRP